MNIPSLIRNGVKTIRRSAGSVRVSVEHFPVTGNDSYGPTYDLVGIPREAYMEFVAEGVALSDGTETASRAKLQFMEPLAVGDRDQFVVPNGYGGTMRVNVLAVRGPMGPDKVPYAPEVLLGDLRLR